MPKQNASDVPVLRSIACQGQGSASKLRGVQYCLALGNPQDAHHRQYPDVVHGMAF